MSITQEKGKWQGYKNYDHYFTISQLSDWMEEIRLSNPTTVISGREHYWNIPAAFDIETSSYYEMGQKRACMYCWSLCINGSTLFARTWSDFVDVIEYISEKMHTDYNHLIIYVHNLGYEFQWIRNWFQWNEVFAIKERRPIKAELTNGITFKCSYILSNYALAYIGENIVKRYLVQKDVGALDYSLVRHSSTPMTEEEIWYSVHDVQVVVSYIQEKLENESDISQIPLTNTGYVRKYCRDACFTQAHSDEKFIKKSKAQYHELMKSLSITSRCEYDQLKWALAGGFTHAAPTWSGKLISGIGSWDLASSYPAVIVMKKFPMSRGVFVGSGDSEDIENLISSGYAVLFTARFHNLRPKFIYENYISVSRCQELSDDYISNNGRLALASIAQVTITDLDWDIIKKCYYYDDVEIFNIRFYTYGYLPKFLILSILHLFENKTSLKDVEGKEVEYMVSKNMINAAYGMMVTAIIRTIFGYTDDWTEEEADKLSQLTDYNNNYNRFLFYPWGVWVTAHARHNLWEAIFEFGSDYVYSDTDSIKGFNNYRHEGFFIIYNNNIRAQLLDMCSHYSIPFSECEPLTKKGKKKLIGVWEYEGEYQNFKTIGAKRYMFEKDYELWFTISGLNKYKGMPYLLTEFTDIKDDDPSFEELCKQAYDNSPQNREQSKKALSQLKKFREAGGLHYENIFHNFNDGLYFPPYATGKQTLTYIDEPFISTAVDYNGVSKTIMELSCIHMEPQHYYLSQTEEYRRFIEGYQDASL